MDLFKLRRDASGPESESTRSLEQLLASPAPSPSPDAWPEASATTSSPSPAFDPKVAATRSESVIAEGFHFNGMVKASADLLRVNGSLDGEIDVRVLVIGPSGSVSGQCRCDSLVIDGRFRGRAECRELHVNSGAVIDGEVIYSMVRAQRGAQLTGKYANKKREAP